MGKSKDQRMARKNHSAKMTTRIRVRSKKLKKELVGVGKATERLILSYIRLSNETLAEDWQRDSGRGGLGAPPQRRTVGVAVVGRFRVAKKRWSILQHIYRRRVGDGWTYEVQFQYRRDGNLSLVKQHKRLLEGDELAKHSEGRREGLDS